MASRTTANWWKETRQRVARRRQAERIPLERIHLDQSNRTHAISFRKGLAPALFSFPFFLEWSKKTLPWPWPFKNEFDWTPAGSMTTTFDDVSFPPPPPPSSLDNQRTKNSAKKTGKHGVRVSRRLINRLQRALTFSGQSHLAPFTFFARPQCLLPPRGRHAYRSMILSPFCCRFDNPGPGGGPSQTRPVFGSAS